MAAIRTRTRRFRPVLVAATFTALAAGCAGPAPPVSDVLLRDARMKWWREARFGLFVHYNLFSRRHDPALRVTGRSRQTGSRAEHDRLRLGWMKPGRDAVRHWAEVAKAAGMKYAVLTAKHQGGFCLWDSRVNEFNAARLGPGFDVVAAFVKACRARGLKPGFYYALRDNHVGLRRAAARDEASRQKLLRYTRSLLRELMTGYGDVAILWYDVPDPLGYGDEWESTKMNHMVRRLQPGIIINDRSMTAQDFNCPEGRIGGRPFPDQDAESCMTFNGKWAWYPTDPKAYRTPRQIVEMLWRATHNGGNLLLNVGPEPRTGRIGAIEEKRLRTVGRWLARNGDAVYGPNDRPEALNQTENNVGGRWTRHGNDAYLWLFDWPGRTDVTIDKARAKLRSCRLLPDGPDLAFTQAEGRITIRGLPAKCPDPICGVAVLQLRFASYPR